MFEADEGRKIKFLYKRNSSHRQGARTKEIEIRADRLVLHTKNKRRSEKKAEAAAQEEQRKKNNIFCFVPGIVIYVFNISVCAREF